MNKKIELSCGYGELRTISNESEEDKIWQSNKEIDRQEGVECQLHTIQEEGENDFGAGFSENLGNGGDQSSIPEQQEAGNETVENVGLVGGEVINIDDVDGVVGGGRLEFREWQVQCVRKKGMKKRTSGSNGTGPSLRSHFGPMSAEFEGKSIRGPNY